ncbi:MAG: acetolactate decarboxylase [Roseivirga sp.]|jgi:acetolactate decarboxylase
MNRYITMLFLVVLMGCQNEAEYQVSNYGVIREIMLENRLDTYTELSVLGETEHLYAIGALKQLTGEIMIMDSQPIMSRASKGEVSIQRDYNEGAILLVQSKVEAWQEIQITSPINDLADLQTLVKAEADGQGLDTSKPFPFLLKGNFDKVEWHIINAAEATEPNHEAYKKAGYKGVSAGVEGQMLGFYSENHEGVFTHHGSYLHVHYVNDAITKMGHVDKVVLNSPMKLSLPKISNK